MSIEDLIIRLRIEEDNSGFEKKGVHNLGEAKANFVEYGQCSKFKKANNKGKCSKLRPKGGISEGSKVTNLRNANFQRGTNPRKSMWLMASLRLCLTLTS